MGNAFYNRGASFNPDELADGDAIEAEFDSVSRGFDTIENLVNVNKAGYPTQTFHVAPATEATHAVQKDQLDASVAGLNNSIAATNADLDQLQTEVGTKLAAASYSASDVLAKLKTVDGTNSGLDADLLDGQEGSYYRNASNINGGTLAKERLPASIDASTSGNAATASKVSGAAPDGGTANLVSGTMAGSDFFRIRIGGSADSGWVEIATSDNGNEPIYVRQYAGDFARSATLLDENGNTSLPGKLIASGHDLGAQGAGLFAGNGDAASSQHSNVDIRSWYGIGFKTTINEQPVPYMENSHWFNTRNGDAGMRGSLSVWGNIQCNGVLSSGSWLSSVAVLTGTIANGGTIPLPSGYTEAQCKWIVSINDSNANGIGWDVREGLSTNHYETRCYTTGRVVTATMHAYNDTTDTGVTYAASANYIIIGVK